MFEFPALNIPFVYKLNMAADITTREGTFRILKLNNWLAKQLDTVGIHKPSPIQTACIPPILNGSDCIGVAKTGSGKTLSFALPIVQTLAEDPYGIFALVLTPTRELALQIADQFRIIGKPINLKDCVVIGGQDMVVQGQELAKKPHVVIATPGRLADHLESCDTFSLKKIRYLVLDEADRLLDGGFDEQLQVIFGALPKKRQTLLFTATITDSVQQLKDLTMDKAFYWEQQSERATVDELDQRFVLTPRDYRDGYLVHVIQKCREKDERGSIIIFTKTCKQCQLVSMTLNVLGFHNLSLHSMKPQRDRKAALSEFKSKQTRILVATDVASRGLDIPEVQFVINHNVPTVTKDYVHRVGRTARAGRKGMAITLMTQHDVKLVEAIEQLINTKLTEMEVDDKEVSKIVMQVLVTMREQDIKLSAMDFDERREINKRKRLIKEGKDPDEEEAKKRKAWKNKQRALRKERKKNLPSVSSA